MNADSTTAEALLSKPCTLVITPREELAVTVERLRAHCKQVDDAEAKVKLELAGDLARSAMFRL